MFECSDHHRITAAGWAYRTTSRGWIIYRKPANRTLAEPLAGGLDYSGLGIKIRQRSWRTVVRRFQYHGSMENMSTRPQASSYRTLGLYGWWGDKLRSTGRAKYRSPV